MKTDAQDATTRPRNLTTEENNSNAIDILLDGRPIATVIDEDGNEVTAEMRELAGLFVAAPDMKEALRRVIDSPWEPDKWRLEVETAFAKAGGQ